MQKKVTTVRSCRLMMMMLYTGMQGKDGRAIEKAGCPKTRELKHTNLETDEDEKVSRRRAKEEKA